MVGWGGSVCGMGGMWYGVVCGMGGWCMVDIGGGMVVVWWIALFSFS